MTVNGEKSQGPSFLTALISGGIAGTSVDVALYPLDTIKTRLQSPEGFFKAGGFRGVYRGLSAAALGSAPGAALFFSTYETIKHSLHSLQASSSSPLLPAPIEHMIAASTGEVMACLVRVPTEVVKQRMQAGYSTAILPTVQQILLHEGGLRGLYSGFGITIMREIPFACIQFPLYELMKSLMLRWVGRPARSYEAALFGSVAGGIAAAVTTPLDVIKTRLMLGKDAAGVPYRGPWDTMLRVSEEGLKQYTEGLRLGKGSALNRWSIFFAGVQPRVMWIGIGGFVFLGAYEQALVLLQPILS